MPQAIRWPGPGDVLVLADEDYRYGVGELKLRVEKVVADPREMSSLEWVRILGRQILANGSEQPRDVNVRVAALARARSDVKERKDING